MFVDELQITVRGGKGGDGCVSFLREKFIQRGGPDGGDGGRGGDVVLRPTTHCNTLYGLTGRSVFAAGDGRPGGAKNCSGRAADDLVVEVPVGTVVLDARNRNVLKDLSIAEQPFVVARGGRGGRGNARFATSTNRAPRQAERGADGEQRDVVLSLKLIADVGLLGMPNAGKSTLLAALTRARPKIADYPFTTLEPMLGIVEGPGETTFVLADVPGLIAGAHAGKGLGDRFLKHIERTRLLLHLVDCSELALEPPARAWRIVRDELAGHSRELQRRPEIVVATKVEDDAAGRRADELEAAVGRPVRRISSATGMGVRELVVDLVRELERLRQTGAS